ncbi:MAG TPA: MFS transporter [Patescibacteria group bacterium]|nr:MFS transporter [Patescibacteria group bacterium]
MDKALQQIKSNQILSLLTYPPYLFFSISVFSSQVAFNALNAILIFLVFYLTSSSFAVAILLFAVLIPQIFISFFGGVMADNFNKKTILIIGNLLRAVVILMLFFNYRSLYLVYFVTFLISAITQLYVPAEAPMIPSLVNKDKLVAANSIFGISLFGSILIGYVLAGPAIQTIGRGNIFAVVSFAFFVAALFAALIPNSGIEDHIKREEIAIKSVAREFSKSFSLIKKTKIVGEAFFLLICSQVIIFILATLLPDYAKSILDTKPEDLSLVLFGPAAIGMVIAALATGSIFNKTSKNKLMNVGIIMSGVALFLLPFASKIFSQSIIGTINVFLPKYLKLNVFNFVLLLAFIAGFANALIFIPSQAAIQEIIPENFRAKIYGLLFALIGVFSLVPIMIAGGVADVVGVGAVFLFLGLSILLVGIWRGGWLKR